MFQSRYYIDLKLILHYRFSKLEVLSYFVVLHIKQRWHYKRWLRYSDYMATGGITWIVTMGIRHFTLKAWKCILWKGSVANKIKATETNQVELFCLGDEQN